MSVRQRKSNKQSALAKSPLELASPRSPALGPDAVVAIPARPRLQKRLIVWVMFFTISLCLGLGVSSSQGVDIAHHVNLSELFALDQLARMRNFTETQMAVLRDAISDRLPTTESSVFIPHIKRQQEKYGESVRLTPHHPVLMIPGFITSALELWEGEPCISDHFRKRIWGSTSMLRLILRDPACWRRHMQLSEEGGDPEAIRLRAASGLEAGDFFVGQFFVWARIIEELGRIGYDHNTMDLMAYDWRLHLIDLEVRDRYFTRLADRIEQEFSIYKKKVLIVTHSYGAVVFHFFMQWATHHRGAQFVDRHIQFVYHVGGAFLGVSKTVAVLLTGEMKDSDLGVFQPVLDAVMNAEDRAKLWRSWGSLYSMLPKGGSAIFTKNNFTVNGEPRSLEDMFDMIRKEVPGFEKNKDKFDHGPELTRPLSETEDPLICAEPSIPSSCYRKSWTSVIRSPLAQARNLTIFCIYGNSIPTESSYDFVGPSTEEGSLHIDVNVNDVENDTIRGIRRTAGDGSVAGESLSYPCEVAWQRSTLNPHAVKIQSRIIPHDKEPNMFSRVVLGFNGKIESSEHVDILGHHSVLEDVTALAAGRLDLVNK